MGSRVRPRISVIIPAHNEQSSILSTLRSVFEGADPALLDVVVACNGCSDATEDLVSQFTPEVTICSTSEASKQIALSMGNAAALCERRIYLDADVQISGGDILKLASTLENGDLEAVAPARFLDRRGVSPAVRWYYDVWELLPAVREGLFGRGAIGLSKAGYDRIRRLPRVMSDDLAISEAIPILSRAIVSNSVVVIHLPRTLADLLRRRVRIVSGTKEVDRFGMRDSHSRTSIRWLIRYWLTTPCMAHKMLVFVLVTFASRLLAWLEGAGGAPSTWHRDESSRSGY
jgi:glycosyltransferase involved in cell wall biosynthesis